MEHSMSFCEAIIISPCCPTVPHFDRLKNIRIVAIFVERKVAVLFASLEFFCTRDGRCRWIEWRLIFTRLFDFNKIVRTRYLSLSCYHCICSMHTHVSVQVARLWKSEKCVTPKSIQAHIVVYFSTAFLCEIYLSKHNLHWYGFSPLWIRKCFVSVELSEKAFLHARHLFQR